MHACMHKCRLWVNGCNLHISLHEDPQLSCQRRSESRTWKLRLHYGDFVRANSKMADSTAGQLKLALRVNKASTKALLLEVVF